MYIYRCTHTYAHIYMYTHICTHIYVYIHILSRSLSLSLSLSFNRGLVGLTCVPYMSQGACGAGISSLSQHESAGVDGRQGGGVVLR